MAASGSSHDIANEPAPILNAGNRVVLMASNISDVNLASLAREPVSRRGDKVALRLAVHYCETRGERRGSNSSSSSRNP